MELKVDIVAGIDTQLGDLPEWKLGDLYPSMDGAEYAGDVEKSLDQAIAFEKKYAGKLIGLAKTDASELGSALRQFEAIEEVMSRVMSYAGLVYTGETTDPVKAKFYGDAQEKITTASSHLLFFSLELNRIEDEVMSAAIEDCPALAHYRSWIEDLRKDKPFQLEDRIEQLFHDKSVSGRSAWNRLFDETMASLRFTIGDEELSVEPALNLLQDRDRTKREIASREIGRVLTENMRVYTDYQYACQRQGDF